MDRLPWPVFHQCVAHYSDDKYIKLSAVLNNTVVWLLPNLLIDRVYGILKYVCDIKAANFITWVFEEVFLATTSPTRINLVI